MALGSTQPLKKKYQKYPLAGKAGRFVVLVTLLPSIERGKFRQKKNNYNMAKMMLL